MFSFSGSKPRFVAVNSWDNLSLAPFSRMVVPGSLQLTGLAALTFWHFIILAFDNFVILSMKTDKHLKTSLKHS